jgi:hypothetical protein
MLALLILGPGYLPLPYVQPVFRPPAEADSLILQVTIGCSWNRCSFCDMYTQPQQKYRVRPLEDVESDLALAAEMAAEIGQPVRRVFLADGDAMGLPVARLAAILACIREVLPSVSRVSSYCLPRNTRAKSVADLAMLREAGLRTMYVGCESGDDEVLTRIGKGETCESSVAALRKLQAAGLKTSVMILHGLGGKHLSAQHVEGSAALLRAAPPNYLSTLVVSFPLGEEKHASGFADAADGKGFAALTTEEVLHEQRSLLQQLEGMQTPTGSRAVIFRSDHASNYLPLRGNLPRDREKLLEQLGAAQRGDVRLRPEWMRGL